MVVVVIVTIVMMVRMSGPAVARVQHGVGTEDGGALVGEVGHVGELMAVKLKHMAELLLLSPLAVEAVADVGNILV